ncbi:hypothetical protein D3876_07275 [Sphingomonas cavernae]|uniref:Uncharacterized protein n=1 Tax=Sphingomonas cavernae TaxID=2320861 RepID=A0A418WS90_9SPHN|nr:hypothetical protein D3876_07275 [Sphingomonas cavernae]
MRAGAAGDGVAVSGMRLPAATCGRHPIAIEGRLYRGKSVEGVAGERTTTLPDSPLSGLFPCSLLALTARRDGTAFTIFRLWNAELVQIHRAICEKSHEPSRD